MNDNFNTDEFKDDDIHLRVNIERYLIHWKWFLLGIVICLIVANIYLRYATRQYKASTTILVKDDKKGGMLSELSAFSDLAIGKGSKGNVDNEVEILKSRTLVERTVKELGLNVNLISKGKVVDVDIYSKTPIQVSFLNTKESFFTNSMRFEYKKLSNNTFVLAHASEDQNAVNPMLSSKKEFKYGEIIPTINGDMVITKSSGASSNTIEQEKDIVILVSPIELVTASYLKRLTVEPISKLSSVVEISLVDPVLIRAEHFLDNLVKIYNQDAAEDKNFVSENTAKFITNRLLLISEELNGVEKDVAQFKTSNKLTDIETEAKLFIEGSNQYSKKGVEIDIQTNMVVSMLDFMRKSGPKDLLPTNMISADDDSSVLMESYNKLVLERNRILKSATEANPAVIALNQQLAAIKLNLTESLKRLQSNLSIQRRDIRGQEGLLDTKIGAIPVQERQFRIIARQQKVKEELYLYLLTKQEETAISLAATEPNARVIDKAKASKSPILPKKKIVYLIGLVFGLVIPFSILYVLFLLDTKVKNRVDIIDKFNIPFLGDVPRSMTPNEMINTRSRSSTAEAIRIVLTNINFMLNQVPDTRAKSIFLTSTIPGEGKTFLSANLSGVFSLSGKKVLLIGMDIRSPKLNDYLGLSNTRGLTDYLSTNNAVIGDYINKLEGYENYNVLLAGTIPPNPTELLMSKKLDELYNQLKQEYDYIIVDTAPVSVVSDTLIVAKHADTFVYVVRANHIDKRLLSIPNTLYKEGKLPNMAILLNDTTAGSGLGYGYGGYGYGYGGYGYGEEKPIKAWYKKIFNS